VGIRIEKSGPNHYEVDPPSYTEPSDSPGTVTLIERSIVLLLVVGLLIGVAAVLRPFTTAILFGTTLAIAIWPLRQTMIGWGLGHGLTALCLLLLSLLIVALPVLAVAPALTEHLTAGIQRTQAYFAATPEQPAWFASVPILGARLGRVWNEVAQAKGNLRITLKPYSETVRQILLTAAQALADSVLQVVLSLIVATTLWVNGDRVAEELRDIFRRLGGTTAVQTLEAVSGAVRGVALGVIGTAMIQAALLTAGLALAGVPGATTLGFIGLLLAISQIGGPLLILIWGGAAWWLLGQDQYGWGIFMILWGLIVSTVDNFLKPLLIGLGVHMPMTLTILGVFGGFVAFGFLGLFIGPALLAAAFILLRAWRANEPWAV
jgi:predicted PurR-regulated permease PerM